MFIGPSLALTGAGRLLYPILVGADSFAPPLTLTRAQVAGVQSSATGADGATLGLFGADTPRFAGAARRLLIEGQRTNAIRNPRAEGAVAGTPGTLPTNWLITGLPSGVTSEVVGVAVVSGVSCLRVRLSGTPGSTTNGRLEPESLLAIGAANGQTWTGSFWLRLHAGSQANLGMNVRVQGRDAGLTGYNVASAAVTLGATASRTAATSTFANAAIIYATSDLQLAFTSGQAVDCTFDVGFPQVEQAAFASSAILPPAGTPGASTRGADLVSASLSSLGIGANGACAVLWSGMIPQAAVGSSQAIFQVDDGTDNNRFTVRNPAGGAALDLVRALAGAVAGSGSIGTLSAGVPFRVGAALDGAGRAAASFNGGAVQAVTGGPTSGLTTLRVGSLTGGAAALFGETLALRVLPYTLSDTDLAAAVAALPT